MIKQFLVLGGNLLLLPNDVTVNVNTEFYSLFMLVLRNSNFAAPSIFFTDVSDLLRLTICQCLTNFYKIKIR